MEEAACHAAITALLSHPDAAVRIAAQIAVDGATRAHAVAPPQQVHVEPAPEEPSAAEPAADEPVAQPSATVLLSEPLVTGADAEEDLTAKGDVTEQLAPVVQSVGARQAF